jgi:hypothetical protein
MFRALTIVTAIVVFAVSAASVPAASGKGSAGSGVGRVGGKMHYDDVSVGIVTDKGVPKLR